MASNVVFMVLLLQAAASLAALWAVWRRGNVALTAVYLWSLFANALTLALPDTWAGEACVAYEAASACLIALAVVAPAWSTFDWKLAGWLSMPVMIAGPLALVVLKPTPCEDELIVVPLVGLAAVACAVALRNPWLRGIEGTAAAWLGWACVTRAVVALAPAAVVSDWQGVATMVWVVGCAAVARKAMLA